MQSIARFIRKMKEQASKQKGFKTNSSAVKDCLYQFVSYLKSTPVPTQIILTSSKRCTRTWRSLWGRLPRHP